MAKVKKRGKGKPFKKGHKINAGKKNNKGKTGTDIETRLTRKIDTVLAIQYFTRNSHLKPSAVRKKIENNEMSLLETMIAKTMVVCADTGDHARLDAVLDRLVGKVPQKQIHAVEDPLEGKTTEELLAEKKKLEDVNRRTVEYLENTDRFKQQTADIEGQYRELNASETDSKKEHDKAD